MQDLKELRLGGNLLILDGHRVMSPIIPQSYKDIDNDISVRGETLIEGAVYTRNLEVVTGPLTINGAFFAKNGVSSNLANVEKLIFRKAVASGEAVVFFDGGKKVFGADINAKTVKLKNAIVAASVFASEITLENCVVLGGVFATKDLKLTNCVVGTFNAPAASLSGKICTLFPSVFTVEPISLAAGARLVNLTLADWGSLLRGTPQASMSGYIELNPETDTQKVSLSDAEGNKILWNSCSVAGKVLAVDLLDMDKLQNHFLLSIGSMSEQLVKQYDFGIGPDGNPIHLTLERLGQFFLDILEEKIPVQQIDGKFSFSEISKYYEE